MSGVLNRSRGTITYTVRNAENRLIGPTRSVSRVVCFPNSTGYRICHQRSFSHFVWKTDGPH